MAKLNKKIAFYFREEVPEAKKWKKKIEDWLKKKAPSVKIVETKPDMVIILGGDGTILEGIRKFYNHNPLFMGMNMGHVGFLASVRKRSEFLQSLEKVLDGKYFESKRMMAGATLLRKEKKIYSGYAFNDILVQNLTGFAEIDVAIGDTVVQNIRGSGALVSTASGSTAYNLSLHGPIIMPDIKCFVVTELLDHNTPTPSIVVKRNKEVFIKVKNFRKRGELFLSKTKKPADMVLTIDGQIIMSLEPGDIVKISRTIRLVRLIEIERNYFFKSLHQKFTFQ